MPKIPLLILTIFLLTGCLDKINSYLSEKRTIKQTGQNIIYINNDDAYYQYGKPPSFTKTNNTIKDKITNLIWQDNKESKTKKLNHKQAISYCSNLVIDKHNNWRLPNIKELLTLIDYGNTKPSINKIFKNTSNSLYYSSTLYKSDNTLAWGVDFKYGDDFHGNIEDKLNIRCVKEKTLIKSKFQRNNKNNIVKDITTNLQWQDNKEAKTTQKTFQEAISYCENLSLGKHNNWRLPNIKELLSIANKNTTISINKIFKNTSFLWLYWSSTTDFSSNHFARAIWFKNGGDWIYPKSSSNFTRCVRNEV